MTTLLRAAGGSSAVLARRRSACTCFAWCLYLIATSNVFTADSFNPPVPAGRGGKIIFAALAVAIGFVLYTLHQTRLEKSAQYGTAGAPHWNFLIIVVD